jgi:hypothetical protein
MKELTEETANKIFDSLGKSISVFEKHADDCASYLKALEIMPETDERKTFKSILRTNLILSYINLDFLTAFRQYLSRELNTNYDKRQAMTKLNIIMCEGYKKIYGFGQQHNKSFWATQIKNAVDFLKEYNEEYTKIENELTALNSTNVFDKNIRNLAVHYDEDPLKVYAMLLSINAEEITNRCILFWRVMEHISKFVRDITCSFELRLKTKC